MPAHVQGAKGSESVATKIRVVIRHDSEKNKHSRRSKSHVLRGSVTIPESENLSRRRDGGTLE